MERFVNTFTDDGNKLSDTVEESAKYSFAEGREEGFLQGVHDEKIEIAKRMKSNGFDNSTIAELTLLSIDEINKL